MADNRNKKLFSWIYSKPFFTFTVFVLIVFLGFIIERLLPLYMIFGISGLANSHVVFVAILLLVIFLFLSGLLLSASYRINIVLISVSTLVALYISEAILQVMKIEPKTKAELASTLPNADSDKLDFRPLRTIFWDLRDKDLISYPSTVRLPSVLKMLRSGETIAEELLDPTPISQISDQKVLVCNESGIPVIEVFDRYGLNNDDSIYSSDNIQIGVVGDSFAQGFCVPRGKTTASLLSKQATTLNVGIAGHGPLKELASIREYLSRFQPKTVLWFYYEGNDPFNMLTEYEHPVLRRYLEDPSFSQNLINRQNDVDAALIKYVEEKLVFEHYSRKLDTERPLTSADLNFFTLGKLRSLLNKLRPRLKEVGPGLLFGQIIKQAKKEVEQWGGELYFVYLPSWKRYAMNYDFNRKEFLKVVNAENVKVIDFFEYVDTLNDPLELFPYQVYGHYTEEGYAELANFIAPHIGLTSLYKPIKTRKTNQKPDN